MRRSKSNEASRRGAMLQQTGWTGDFSCMNRLSETGLVSGQLPGWPIAAREWAALLWRLWRAGSMLARHFPASALAHVSTSSSQPATAARSRRRSLLDAGTCASGRCDLRTISVVGAERLEPTTILSYIRLRVGQEYTSAGADEALKDLGATELFANFSIRNDDGNVIINVTENPVINRIVLEGNERLKEDKILPEIKLSPRQIFTRSKVRADVARIIELYKRQGRFAAQVEPKMVQLPQNRVDIVFEISEGPKSKVRQINVLGNEKFSYGSCVAQMVTKQDAATSFFSYEHQLRPVIVSASTSRSCGQFYLTKAYADFRVVSASRDETDPGTRIDSSSSYVVEEGRRYKFGACRGRQASCAILRQRIRWVPICR